MKSDSLGIPAQSESIYRLLLKSKALTAKQLGKRLQIFPHAVYRSVKILIEFGLVERLPTYPTTFQAKSVTSAVEFFALNAREDFLKRFVPKDFVPPTQIATKMLGISFIQNRQDLLTRSNTDIHNAKEQVNHIVSGLEIPAETILAIKNATERGVNVRFLVQRLDEVNRSMLLNWKKLGIGVKCLPLLEARIVVIDSKISYITSYNPAIKDEAIGVRFDYSPIAKILNDIFDERWYLGKSIN